MKIKNIYGKSVIAFVCNMAMVYAVYAVCRVVFFVENYGLFADTLATNSWADLLTGCWMFDTSAILYTNAIYALAMLFPFHWKECSAWHQVCRWLFVVVNALCVSINLADSVYFQYTGRRTTLSVFKEFSNEGNLTTVMGAEVLRHWYIVVVGILLIAALWWFYVMPADGKPKGKSALWRYYAMTIVAFCLYIPITICGMRGGATTAVRPITISNANQYVNRPAEAALILNTPFAMIRTSGKKSFVNPQYFSEEEMNRLFSPVHQPEVLSDSMLATMPKALGRKNVVVLIVESFGREYIGAYNERLEGGHYKGYTPFVDSLYQHCLSFDYTFCNGRKSIDGMPSILSSIPMFVEPFFLTSASLNKVSGLAGELGKAGYYSAFFHGAENGSMGFQAFARATGFKDYFGRTEYNADKRFGGDKDFDGTWAIWDEPFMQFYAHKMSEMKQPFVTALFTASSHHPYVVPEEYKNVYKEEGNNVIHKCIRYVDHALEQFFAYAKTQPWYANTIFVITSDHTNLSDHAEYETDLGGFGSPILFFDPSGELIKPGRRHCIAQQIDIMPSLLGLLGYDNPYVAFGKNLFATADADTWAVNYNNGIYQYVGEGGYLLQFDGLRTTALYDINADWMLKTNLKDDLPDVTTKMESRLKAIIQSYMQRMIEDRICEE